MAQSLISIDIGNTRICSMIGTIQSDESLTISGVGSSVSRGIDRGRITNQDDLREAIAQSVNRARAAANYRLPTLAVCSLLHDRLISRNNTGFIHTHQRRLFSQSDIDRCFQRSAQLSDLPHGYTIIHAIPLTYFIDQKPVSSPLTVPGNTLEIQSQLIITPTQPITDIYAMLRTLSLRPIGILFDLMAIGQLMISHQHHTGATVIDMGTRHTRVGYFKSDKLHHAACIPIGGDTITSDIAHCLAIDKNQATRIKHVFGQVDHTEPGALVITTDTGKKTIPSKLLHDIITARLAELMTLIRAAVPSGISWESQPVYLHGGGSLLTGISRYVTQALGCCVQPQLPDTIAQISHVSHIAALGLIHSSIKTKLITPQPPTRNLLSRLKSRWLSS